MSSSYTFSGASFSVVSVTRVNSITVRVVFGQAPLQVNAAGTYDALNASNYAVTGPSSLSVVAVSGVLSSSLAVDLTLNGPLSTGVWTIAVANVKTPGGTSLAAPTSGVVTIVEGQTSLTAGAEEETAFNIIRKHLNQALAGPKWDALIAALATADDFVWGLAQSIWGQMFLGSASGSYLDVLAANNGDKRPSGQGDDSFRELAIELSTGRVTYNSILRILRSFYGKEALHAHVDSGTGPWALSDGQTVVFDFEGVQYTYVVNESHFQFPAAVTPQELATSLSAFFQGEGVEATASVVGSAVRVYSPSLGLRSSVTVSGTASLGFDTATHTTLSGDRTVVLSVGDGTATVSVPVTPETDRTSDTAGYVYGNTPVTVASVKSKNGTVTVTTTGVHGLTDGSLVDFSGFVPRFEIPWHTASSGATFGGSGLESLVALSIPAVVCICDAPAIVPLASGGVAVFGGDDGGGVNADGFVLNTSNATTINDGSDADGASDITFTATVTSMGLPRLNQGASALLAPFADSVFVTGGWTGASVASTTEMLTGGVWTSKQKMLMDRRSHCQVTLTGPSTLRGYVFVCGGYGGGATALAESELYNPYLDVWTAKAPMAIPRSGARAVVLPDGKVLVIGGKSDNGPLNSCELYDPATNSWSFVRSMGQGRYNLIGSPSRSFEALLYGNEVYVIGNTSTPVGGVSLGRIEVEIYDYPTNTWRRGPSLNVPTTATARGACIRDGFLYTAAAGAAKLNLATGRWQAVVGPNWVGNLNSSCAATTHAVVFLGKDGGALAATGDHHTGKSTGINGVHEISVVDSTHFTFSLPAPEWAQMAADALPVSMKVEAEASGEGVFVAPNQAQGQQGNVLWVTGTVNLTQDAQKTIADSVARDVDLTWAPVYPGDRGLGAEGTGRSDKYVVWGPDDLDDGDTQ